MSLGAGDCPSSNALCRPPRHATRQKLAVCQLATCQLKSQHKKARDACVVRRERGQLTAFKARQISAFETKSVAGTQCGGFDIDEKTVSSRQASFRTVTTEIEGLIEQLTNINDDMNDVAGAQSSASWANNPAIQHTLRRHREILRDYGSEYRRARDNVDQVLQRELLLSSSNESTRNPSVNNRARGYDMYLKENDHINACDRLLDEQIEMAMSTKENVARQGINLRGISTRLHQITKKYPAINNLMQKIKTKKQKNTLILAGVISSCLIFTIFWILN